MEPAEQHRSRRGVGGSTSRSRVPYADLVHVRPPSGPVTVSRVVPGSAAVPRAR